MYIVEKESQCATSPFQVKTVLDMITLDTELVVVTARPVVAFQTDDAGGSTLREMTGGNVSFKCVSTGIPAPTIKFRYLLLLRVGTLFMTC